MAVRAADVSVPASRIWILKLGGSLARSPLLGRWLDALNDGRGRLVVVPGGGPFADEVRSMQRLWRFGEATAHRLAIMAMEQFGLMLADLRPILRPASTREAISARLREGLVPVWMPSAMVLARKDIPESWEVTSDSLAAWLAGKLGADCLILVKSVAVRAGSTAADLVRLGTVDPAFPGFLARSRVACYAIAARHHAELAKGLASGGPPGTRVRAVADSEGASIAGEDRSANIGGRGRSTRRPEQGVAHRCRRRCARRASPGR